MEDSNEITLKELVANIKSLFSTIMNQWWKVALITSLFLAFFLYKHFNHERTYNAELRFVVEGQSGVGGGLSGLLGSFGMSKSGKLNPYKVIEVLKSNDIFEKSILATKSDSIIADRILNEYHLIDKWIEKNPTLDNFQFVNTDSIDINRNLVFKKLKSFVWGSPNNDKPLSKISLDDNTGIYKISTATRSEKLSIDITNKFYDNVKKFFEQEVFENQMQTAEILQMKMDSIRSLRNYKVQKLARMEDSNYGLVSRELKSEKTILSQEISALSLTYAEVLKNYEMTDINLKDSQPLFMIIDAPISPLWPSQSSLIMSLIYGLLLGGFVSVVIIVIQEIFKL